MDECQEAVGQLDQDDCDAARVGLWQHKSVKVTMVTSWKSGYRGWDKSMMNKGVIHETTGWPIRELKPQWLRVWYIEMKGIMKCRKRKLDEKVSWLFISCKVNIHMIKFQEGAQ